MSRLCVLLLLPLLFCSVAEAKRPALGAAAPPFRAQGVDGKTYTASSFNKAKAVVVCFVSGDCPVSAAYQKRLDAFAKTYAAKGVRVIALNAADSLKEMRSQGKFNFAYAQDPGGVSARAFGVRLTPEVFVLDAARKVQYRGAFDNSQRRPTDHFVRDAVEAILSGKPVKVTQTKPFGCSLRIAKAGALD